MPKTVCMDCNSFFRSKTTAAKRCKTCIKLFRLKNLLQGQRDKKENKRRLQEEQVEVIPHEAQEENLNETTRVLVSGTRSIVADKCTKSDGRSLFEIEMSYLTSIKK